MSAVLVNVLLAVAVIIGIGFAAIGALILVGVLADAHRRVVARGRDALGGQR